MVCTHINSMVGSLIVLQNADIWGSHRIEGMLMRGVESREKDGSR